MEQLFIISKVRAYTDFQTYFYSNFEILFLLGGYYYLLLFFLAWLMKERSGCDDLPGDMIPPKLR